MKIRLGTRGSKLAIQQAEYVRQAILSAHPSLDIAIVPIVTTGDNIVNGNTTQAAGGIKGLFTKEIDYQLLTGSIDIGVHSVKDMSCTMDDRIAIAAVLPRGNPDDAFVSNKAKTIAELPPGSVLGTSSIRRRLFLKIMRSDIEVVNFRGNLDTRFDKIDRGVVDATIMAVNGILRLKAEERIASLINKNDMLPALGQGAIAAVALKHRTDILSILQAINCTESNIAVSCERSFAAELGANCQTPIAALANIKGDDLILEYAFIEEHPLKLLRGFQIGSVCDHVEIGKTAAHDIVRRRS